MQKLGAELHGKNFRRRGIEGPQYVAAIERQANWNPHVHALVGDRQVDLAAAEYTPLMREMKLWCEEEWGFSRWERVNAEDDARSYVVDYAAKTGELYLSDQLEALEVSQVDFITQQRAAARAAKRGNRG
jgi:hypothetical protein